MDLFGHKTLFREIRFISWLHLILHSVYCNILLLGRLYRLKSLSLQERKRCDVYYKVMLSAKIIPFLIRLSWECIIVNESFSRKSRKEYTCTFVQVCIEKKLLSMSKQIFLPKKLLRMLHTITFKNLKIVYVKSLKQQVTCTICCLS